MKTQFKHLPPSSHDCVALTSGFSPGFATPQIHILRTCLTIAHSSFHPSFLSLPFLPQKAAHTSFILLCSSEPALPLSQANPFHSFPAGSTFAKRVGVTQATTASLLQAPN